MGRKSWRGKGLEELGHSTQFIKLGLLIIVDGGKTACSLDHRVRAQKGKEHLRC